MYHIKPADNEKINNSSCTEVLTEVSANIMAFRDMTSYSLFQWFPTWGGRTPGVREINWITAEKGTYININMKQQRLY
jgi:hypothetical protein